MPHVVEINCLSEADGYASCWQELLSQTREASFLQSLDWLRCYWRHFGEGQKLRLLVVLGPDGPLGILPLIVVRESTRLGSLRMLTYPLRDWATFYGPLGPNPTATLVSGMRHIRSTRRDWDVLDLRSTNQDTDCGRTPVAMRLAGFRASESVRKQTDLVEFRGTWPEYLAGRSSKFRNNLRRNAARAERRGTVSYERYRPRGIALGEADPRWDLYETCLEISARTRQAAMPKGTTLSHAAVRDFFRDVHQTASDCGAIDINILRIGSRPAAFTYNYHCRGVVTGIRMGFDPEFAAVSPGALLLSLSVRDSFERGDRVLDLGTDRLDYKRQWRTRSVPVVRYAYYATASPRSQLLGWKRRLFPSHAQAK
jgi:CelD/BcsL family acetyltransferase involved in cellulose biosynthesis